MTVAIGNPILNSPCESHGHSCQKSGYARLIRDAVTARVNAVFLGDVFAPQPGRQTAVFEYKTGNVQSVWTL